MRARQRGGVGGVQEGFGLEKNEIKGSNQGGGVSLEHWGSTSSMLHGEGGRTRWNR